MRKYLIAYGADNEMFACEADDSAHAVEQFKSWSEDRMGDINDVFLMVPVAAPIAIEEDQSVDDYIGFAGEGTFTGAIETARVIAVPQGHFDDADDAGTEIEQLFKDME